MSAPQGSAPPDTSSGLCKLIGHVTASACFDPELAAWQRDCQCHAVLWHHVYNLHTALCPHATTQQCPACPNTVCDAAAVPVEPGCVCAWAPRSLMVNEQPPISLSPVLCQIVYDSNVAAAQLDAAVLHAHLWYGRSRAGQGVDGGGVQ
jgi:hypothetical protein